MINNLHLVCGDPHAGTVNFWQSEAEVYGYEIKKRPRNLVEDWKKKAPQLFDEFITLIYSKWQEAARLDGLEREVLLLKERVAKIERFSPLYVLIETFAPEPYEVVRSFNVVVRKSDEDFIATFFDVNLSASGSTEAEAITNLKDIIIGVFEVLIEHDEKNLGPEPLRQLHVLKTVLKKAS